ncbi:MAG: hypothetical protein QOJ42_4153 [Acidobacteriaceae bacterium]|nr:hypothetical protein [Acidobacteriaceae bacterium]
MALTRWFAAICISLTVLLADPMARAQPVEAAVDLPDVPQASPQQTSPGSPTATPAPHSDSQTSAAPAAGSPQEDERKKAQEQLDKQLHQRVFGVMATFNTTNNRDALPLSTRQKYKLFFKSASDPWPFALTAVSAGIDQAQNSFPAYGQGVEGYAKRWGAGYTDYFTGNLLGNAVLASLLKEDPRYFQKGTGSFATRALWAAGGTVWCKRDNGTWGPNYANVMGNLMGAAVSNLYYPAADRTAGETLERGFTVTAQAIIGSEVIEFWPDMVRHHKRKQAEKLARQGIQTPTPAPQP